MNNFVSAQYSASGRYKPWAWHKKGSTRRLDFTASRSELLLQTTPPTVSGAGAAVARRTTHFLFLTSEGCAAFKAREAWLAKPASCPRREVKILATRKTARRKQG